MTTLTIKSNIHDYQVVFSRNFQFLEALSQIQPHALVIDHNIVLHYEGIISTFFNLEDAFVFDALEENKSLAMLEQMYDFMMRRSAKRNITLISIGGGITQDVTGFLASTLYRGVPWVFVPTTLLAQTDSCIGSKTSLNYKRYKNLLGTFYPPKTLYINADFRATLTDMDYYSGIGEVIKLQLMKETERPTPTLLAKRLQQCRTNNNVLDQLIRENLDTKISYMENDEFDLGRRNLLNYGHCLGHALESASHYAVPHGIAVNIGIVFANLLSVRRGLLSSSYCQELIETVNRPCIYLPLKAEYFVLDDLLDGFRNDKKRVGSALSVVLPAQNARLIKVDDVCDEEIAEIVDELKEVLDVSG